MSVKNKKLMEIGCVSTTNINSNNTMNNKFKDMIDHMPTLKQVQNYVKTRRRKMGETNSMLDDEDKDKAASESGNTSLMHFRL